MRALDGTGLASQVARGHSTGARRGLLAAALLGITLLCCLSGPLATAGAAPAPAVAPSFSAEALLARLALQQAVLTPGVGQSEQFGFAVALSGDTALVGAEHEATAGTESGGAAYVFTRSGGSWTQQAELVASDGAADHDYFGYSVAVFGDTALVGAPSDAIAGEAGAAYVFTRTGTTWTARQKLTAFDGVAGDKFGVAVALSGEETALVGARLHVVAGKATGAAYVFVSSTSAPTRPLWKPQAELNASDGAAGDDFGGAVALSGDTALIGAERHDAAGVSNAGAAYVFTRSAGSWTQQQMLSADDGTVEAFFGWSLALLGDTALIGAPDHDAPGKDNDGAAYVFTRSAGVWSQQQMLTAPDGDFDDLFGDSVALSADRALVGAQCHAVGGVFNAGAAYVFTRSAGWWTQQQMLSAADGATDDQFGRAVALSGDTALMGAPYRNTDGQVNRGAAYVFVLDPVPALTYFSPTLGLAGTPVTLTGSGFAGATAVDFKDATAGFTVDSPTQITAIVPKGATSGPIAVTTPGGIATSAGSFTVLPAPILTKVSPAAGKRGALVSVIGKWFGASQGTSVVKFGSKTCSKYVSWSDKLIKCRVPATAKLGTVKVTVKTASGHSNAVSFLVKH